MLKQLRPPSRLNIEPNFQTGHEKRLRMQIHPKKLSVIITVYNVEAYIIDCLRSVKSQTLAPDEIIICDDASTDRTLEMVRGFPINAQIIGSTTNRGALLNTLSGLNASTGGIVCFLDGDDTWPPNKLELVVRSFDRDREVILITHNHRRVDSLGQPTGIQDDTHRNIERIQRISDKNQQQLELRRSALLRLGFWFGSAYSIRKSALNLPKFTHLVSTKPEAKFSYLDLVLGPFIISDNPTGRLVYLADICFDYRIHEGGSAHARTLDKQMLGLTRIKCTNLLTKNCLMKTASNKEIDYVYSNLIAECDYLEHLYAKNYKAAIRIFFSISRFLIDRNRLGKELLRFLLVRLFGTAKFLRIK